MKQIAGSLEAEQIIHDHRPCETATNGTGYRCACANYWLRAKGFGPDDA